VCVFVFVLCRVTCNCLSLGNSGTQKSWTALNAIQEGQGVPSFMLNAYPVYQCHKSALSTELLRLILSDSMSGKSFEEMASTFWELRVSKYLDARLSYIEAVSYWKGTRRVDGSDKTVQPLFSTFEDKMCWNESVIGSQYLTDVFTGFVEKRKDIMVAYLGSVKPHEVISLDYTFDSAKRTKDNSNRSSGSCPSIEKNSLIFALNGTGQVAAFRRSKNERLVFVFILLLTYIIIINLSLFIDNY